MRDKKMKKYYVSSLLFFLAGTLHGKTDDKVLQTLQKFDSALTKETFTYKLADISQNKSCRSPIVFLNGKSGYCGTGGCDILVLDCTADGYKIIGNTSVAMTPLYVAKTSTHGYRDIKVNAGRKGTVVLKFDGKKYPDNASIAPKTKVLPGDHLLLSDEDVF